MEWLVALPTYTVSRYTAALHGVLTAAGRYKCTANSTDTRIFTIIVCTYFQLRTNRPTYLYDGRMKIIICPMLGKNSQTVILLLFRFRHMHKKNCGRLFVCVCIYENMIKGSDQLSLWVYQRYVSISILFQTTIFNWDVFFPPRLPPTMQCRRSRCWFGIMLVNIIFMALIRSSHGRFYHSERSNSICNRRSIAMILDTACNRAFREREKEINNRKMFHFNHGEWFWIECVLYLKRLHIHRVNRIIWAVICSRWKERTDYTEFVNRRMIPIS